MELNELRVGNLYHWKAEGKDYVLPVRREDFSNDNYKNFYSIPLTEEWLEKFGFEKLGLYNYSLPDMSFLVYWDKLKGIYLCSRCGEKIPLKYVHKLQNLYFAVKEEELTIKE